MKILTRPYHSPLATFQPHGKRTLAYTQPGAVHDHFELQANPPITASKPIYFGAMGGHTKKEATLIETLGTLILYHMRNGANSRSIASRGLATDTDSLTSSLAHLVRQETKPANQKLDYLHQEDIDRFSFMIRPHDVREAVTQLHRDGLVTLDGLESNQFRLTLNTAQLNGRGDQTTVEDIIADNLPYYLYAARRLDKAIETGTITDKTILGDDLELDGVTLGRTARLKALSLIASSSGRVALRRGVVSDEEPLPRTFYQAVQRPTGRQHPDVAKASRPDRAILYHMIAHDSLRPFTHVPNDRQLSRTYGLSSAAFSRAKANMVTQHLLSAHEPHHLVLKRLDETRVRDLLADGVNDQDQDIERFLANQKNSQKAEKYWQPMHKLITDCQFETGTPTATQRVRASKVAKKLLAAPVPLLVRSNPEKRGFRCTLNPNVDYDRLNKDIQTARGNLSILSSGLLFGLAPWQLPRVYQNQVEAIPTLWLRQQKGDEDSLTGAVDLYFGLSSAVEPFDSTFLNDLNHEKRHLHRLPQSGRFDMARYGNQMLDLVASLYPLPQLNSLQDLDSVSLSHKEYLNMKGMFGPLRHMGFAINDTVTLPDIDPAQ